MTQSDGDRKAILKVIDAETDAYLKQDYDAWQDCWHDGDVIERIQTHVGSGVTITKGAAVKAQMKDIFAQPQAHQPKRTFRRERYKVVIGGEMAWVSYDQVDDAPDMPNEIPGKYHELKILQKVDGTWKIACLVSTQIRTVPDTCPLIEVNGQCDVLSMNAAARDRLADHPLLFLKANKVWARNTAGLAQLRDAIGWVTRIRERHTPNVGEEAVVRTVPLGRDDAGTAHVCWAFLRDGRLLIAFDDSERLRAQVNTAGAVYGLSEAQKELGRQLIGGYDLGEAARAMNISTNTAKTHLQRIYDKVGVRSQPALVRMLLSADRHDL